MEDKLVTLAILTYTKAQILKNVLENEGIETYIHNVNQIQPVVSSGVRLRIKESDLPRALKLCPPKKFRTVSTCKPSSSAILCMLPLGNESLILRSSLNVIVLMSHKFNG